MEQRFVPDSINNIERDEMKLKASFRVMGKSFWSSPILPDLSPGSFYETSHKYERFSEWCYLLLGTVARGIGIEARRETTVCQWYMIYCLTPLAARTDDGKSRFFEFRGSVYISVKTLRVRIERATYYLLGAVGCVLKEIICILYRGTQK